MIHSFENDTHNETKLKAKTSDERENWITHLKLVSQPVLPSTQRDPINSAPETKTIINNAYECLICYETSIDSRIVVATRCGHIFCKECIDKWISVASTCPMCKSVIHKDKLIRLYGTVTNEKARETEPVNQLECEQNRPERASNFYRPDVSIASASDSLGRLISEAITKFISLLVTEMLKSLSQFFAVFILIGMILIFLCVVSSILIWAVFGFKAMLITDFLIFLTFKIYLNRRVLMTT